MNRNEVALKTPCTLDWRKMTPAEGGRFCGDCKKVVRDLSTMTEREARKLLKRENGGELCVRFVFDKQGRLFFGKDAPRPNPSLVPVGALLSRARAAAAAAAIVAVPFATQACDAITAPLGITSSSETVDDSNNNNNDLHEMMGGISMDPNEKQIAYGDPDASPDADVDADASAPKTDAESPDADAAPPNEDQDGGGGGGPHF